MNLDIKNLKENLNKSQILKEARMGYISKTLGLKFEKSDVLVTDNSIKVMVPMKYNFNDNGWKISYNMDYSNDDYEKMQEQSNLAKDIQKLVDNAVIKNIKIFEQLLDKDIKRIIKKV